MNRFDDIWREHLAFNRLVAEIKGDIWHLHYLRKYRSDQPRIPAGSPDGG